MLKKKTPTIKMTRVDSGTEPCIIEISVEENDQVVIQDVTFFPAHTEELKGFQLDDDNGAWQPGPTWQEPS